MKTLLLSVGFLAALPLAAAAQATPEDLKKLAAAGVGDEVILAFVRSMGPAPKLSAGEIADLKKAGASDRVLQALIGAPSEPAPEAPVERAVERPVYVAPRTYYETEPWVPVSYSFAPRYYYPSYYSSYGYPAYRSYYGSCYPGYGYGGYYGGRYGCGSGWGLGVGYYGGRWGVGVGFRW